MGKSVGPIDTFIMVGRDHEIVWLTSLVYKSLRIKRCLLNGGRT